MSAKIIPIRLAGPSPVELSDEALLAACGEGDATALSLLYRRHHATIARFVSRVLGSQSSEIDDVVQQVFLTAWKDAERFRGQSSVRGWLFGIAANLARRHQRSQRRRDFAFFRLSLFSRTTTDAIDDDVARRQLVGKVGVALAALPHDLRVAYVMCEIEELAGVEAAKILGLRPGTLWRRLHDARKRLRIALEERSTP